MRSENVDEPSYEKILDWYLWTEQRKIFEYSAMFSTFVLMAAVGIATQDMQVVGRIALICAILLLPPVFVGRIIMRRRLYRALIEPFPEYYRI
jgi:hypothetical protein